MANRKITEKEYALIADEKLSLQNRLDFLTILTRAYANNNMVTQESLDEANSSELINRLNKINNDRQKTGVLK